mmetsp:Transcript_1436/g.2094  ORF Transcript_1436/g.2094 Transcript_1436/m.2094 type:complete len:243 (+) Transcript_1436:189-917(+)
MLLLWTTVIMVPMTLLQLLVHRLIMLLTFWWPTFHLKGVLVRASARRSESFACGRLYRRSFSYSCSSFRMGPTLFGILYRLTLTRQSWAFSGFAKLSLARRILAKILSQHFPHQARFQARRTTLRVLSLVPNLLPTCICRESGLDLVRARFRRTHLALPMSPVNTPIWCSTRCQGGDARLPQQCLIRPRRYGLPRKFRLRPSLPPPFYVFAKPPLRCLVPRPVVRRRRAPVWRPALCKPARA